MKEIKLTQGQVAFVDDDDYDYLNQWKWYAVKDKNTFYAVREERVGENKGMQIKMHRLIMGCTKGDGKIVDHIDHIGFNNQKHNLRECTHQQNAWNMGDIKKTGTSKYVGVSKNVHKGITVDGKSIRRETWIAYITLNGKRKTIGRFKTEEHAAFEYNRVVLTFRGEFGSLNKLPDGYIPPQKKCNI